MPCDRLLLHIDLTCVTILFRQILVVAVRCGVGVQEDELSSAECLGYRSLQQRLCGDDGPLRDLSAWRVTIPRVSSHADPDNPRRTQLCYSIQVRRVDVLEGECACRVNVFNVGF